jgi:hypothetical protein
VLVERTYTVPSKRLPDGSGWGTLETVYDDDNDSLLLKHAVSCRNSADNLIWLPRHAVDICEPTAGSTTDTRPDTTVG